ncbi:hypothetical protein [Turicibacter sanguinis]|uniref:hypothetical protein n=1 Tax=Turicibacter sanguinis TaxID=154288 RepID=UPI0012BBBBA5|nr:hypothetical protein [Turicibacter sanguinis]MDB8437706.1 hypothetical protein [Turicibacter sanguinis]MTP74143.1 hypothetical protein [Turicibacter sanguinis]
MKHKKYSLTNENAQKIVDSFEKESSKVKPKFESRYVQAGDESFKKVKSAIKNNNKGPLC